METPGPGGAAAAPNRQFATTQWTMVLAAGRASTEEGRRALTALCERYWYPVYAFVRSQGCDADEAMDVTQGFFARLLEKRDLASVERGHGRFRSWLLASAKHYLAN